MIPNREWKLSGNTFKTSLPDLNVGPYRRRIVSTKPDKDVHPMCQAMARTQLKYVTLSHDGINAVLSSTQVPLPTPRPFSTETGVLHRHELPKMEPVTETAESRPIPLCRKCGHVPMVREHGAMSNFRTWVECTGCPAKTAPYKSGIVAMREWKRINEPVPIAIARDFTCPKCGSHQFGTSNCLSLFSEWIGHCHGHVNEDGPACDFTWHRQTQDHEVMVLKASPAAAGANACTPESEEPPEENDVLVSDTVPPEIGKRYVCRNGEVTEAMGAGLRIQTYPFRARVNGVTRTWMRDGKHDESKSSERDLIAEYHEPEPSPPAEQSPDDVIELTDLPDSVKTALNEVIKRKLNEPVKAPVTKPPTTTDINSNKPRMKHITLREYSWYEFGIDQGLRWAEEIPLTTPTNDAVTTNRSVMVEVPE